MVKLTLIQGDALKVLPLIQNESVDLIVTDPPYFVLDKCDWDLFTNKEEYVDFTVKYLNLFYNVLKTDCSCLLFWSQKHLFLFDKILKQTKFNLYKMVVWHYLNVTKGFSNKRWIYTFDFILHLVKGEKPKIFNANFSLEENKDVWVFPKPQSNYSKDKKYHSTQKPLELISRIIKMFSNEGDVVLDAFLGSGTTMVACRNLKRNCIGIEINPSYIKICKERLNWGSSIDDKIDWEFREV